MSVGAVLRDKMTNMENWLRDAQVPLSLRVDTLHTAQLILFAKAIPKHNRNFAVLHADSDLLDAAEKANMGIRDTLSALESRVELHDKFWRYLELFSALVA